MGLEHLYFQRFPGDADIAILYFKKSVCYLLAIVTLRLRIAVILIFCFIPDFLVLNYFALRFLFMFFTFQTLKQRLSLLTYFIPSV